MQGVNLLLEKAGKTWLAPVLSCSLVCRQLTRAPRGQGLPGWTEAPSYVLHRQNMLPLQYMLPMLKSELLQLVQCQAHTILQAVGVYGLL